MSGVTHRPAGTIPARAVSDPARPPPPPHDDPTRHPARTPVRLRLEPRLLLQAPGGLRGVEGRHPPPAALREVPLLAEVVRDRHGRRYQRLDLPRRGPRR